MFTVYVYNVYHTILLQFNHQYLYTDDTSFSSECLVGQRPCLIHLSATYQRKAKIWPLVRQ